jgi:hypothetical protein
MQRRRATIVLRRVPLQPKLFQHRLIRRPTKRPSRFGIATAGLRRIIRRTAGPERYGLTTVYMQVRNTGLPDGIIGAGGHVPPIQQTAELHTGAPASKVVDIGHLWLCIRRIQPVGHAMPDRGRVPARNGRR